MSQRERYMLMLAALVAVLFGINLLVPVLENAYNDRKQAIGDLRLAVMREERLTEEAVAWHERRLEAQIRQSDMESRIFTGDTIPLIEAGIQRDLARYAREAGLTINSTGLAEHQASEAWLMISQEVSFQTTNPGDIMVLFDQLEQSVPRLRVKAFSLDRSRSRYSGDITVVGFARSTASQGAANERA